MDRPPSAYVVKVYIYTAEGYREYPVVFDHSGRIVEGKPGDTIAAVQIRYCETVGVPVEWFKHSVPVSLVKLYEMRRTGRTVTRDFQRVEPCH